MILEGVVTTQSVDGNINVAPMGPLVEPSANFEIQDFELRPFESSTTYRNLMQSNVGVLHVTDNVLMLARAAIGKLDPPPETRSGATSNCHILDDCCRWMEFEAREITTDSPRKMFHCKVNARGTRRHFFGFNRAKHSIIEATILMTRIDFVPLSEISDSLERARVIVEKTGGPDEHEAWAILNQFAIEKGHE